MKVGGVKSVEVCEEFGGRLEKNTIKKLTPPFHTYHPCIYPRIYPSYSRLLCAYASNRAEVNACVIRFLDRVRGFVIEENEPDPNESEGEEEEEVEDVGGGDTGDDDNDDDGAHADDQSKKKSKSERKRRRGKRELNRGIPITFERILWQISMLQTYERVMRDRSLAHELKDAIVTSNNRNVDNNNNNNNNTDTDAYVDIHVDASTARKNALRRVLSFCKSVSSSFLREADANPLLFVDTHFVARFTRAEHVALARGYIVRTKGKRGRRGGGRGEDGAGTWRCCWGLGIGYCDCCVMSLSWSCLIC